MPILLLFEGRVCSEEFFFSSRTSAFGWRSIASPHDSDEDIVIAADLLIDDILHVLAKARVGIGFPAYKIQSKTKRLAPSDIQLANERFQHCAFVSNVAGRSGKDGQHGFVSRHDLHP